jgi:hypothetical protein
MSTHFVRYLRIKLYKVILVCLTLATLVCGYYYFLGNNPKLEALFAGLFTGLLVAIIQYILQWNEHSEIETIKELGILRILPHRDERRLYEELIVTSRTEILVLGNTASRFLEDFAHETRADSHALLEALARGVKVRILLPKAIRLSKADRPRAEISKRRLTELATRHKNLEHRYFDHPPIHSIVKVDSACLVGPIFPNVKSKDSPTIYAYSDSRLVNEYLKHFDAEWNNAEIGQP